MLKKPIEWSAAERQKIRRALAEHRLVPLDLFFWQELEINGRSVFSLACELMSTTAEVERRLGEAKERLESAWTRPDQEAYLGRWVSS